MRNVHSLLLFAATLACTAPAPAPAPIIPTLAAEATSLLGTPLVPPAPTPESRARHETLLAEAEAVLAKNPADLDAAIWAGRRVAYLGRYREAIQRFTDALARHPDESRLLRHRGHRYLTVRELAHAEADLARAAERIAGTADEIEPDGLPNAQNQPTSTHHANIWYHLGLARYLQGNFAGARQAYEAGLAVPGHPDMDLAMRNWLVLTLRRLGDETAARTALAAVDPKAPVIESGDYLRLLLLHRGEGDPEALLAEASRAGSELSFATVAYGVGAWYLVEGKPDRAREIFRQVVDRGPWASFGALAAEAELARSEEKK